jgi:hypothetical protein
MNICSSYNPGRHSCRGAKLFEAEEHLAKGFVRPLDLSGKFSVVLDQPDYLNVSRAADAALDTKASVKKLSADARAVVSHSIDGAVEVV